MTITKIYMSGSPQALNQRVADQEPKSKETLRKINVVVLGHMSPSYLRWRVILFYMVFQKP
mgnify:CR=1 FL=1